MEVTPGATRPLGHCSNEKMLCKLSFILTFASPYGNGRSCPQCQAGVVHQFWNCVVDLEGNQFNPINLSIQNIAIVQFNQEKRHLISLKSKEKYKIAHRLDDNLEICSHTRLVFLRPVDACSLRV